MKYIKLFIASAISLNLLWSCTKFLDYNEMTYYSEDDIWYEYSRVKSMLTNIYSFLPHDFIPIDGAMRSSATDDAVHVYDLSEIVTFNNGSWSALNAIDDVWGNMYTAIRAANLWLEKAKEENFAEIRWNTDYPQTMIQFRLMPAQARFLRAFYYFELIKRYGDVPLITKVLTEEEANKVSRNSFDEVVDFIISECDAISTELPATWTSITGAETGRATKGAALALKARTLLYAASPLHNTTGSQAKWIEAATAAKQVIDMNRYSLDATYASAFNNLSSKELLLERRFAAANTFETANFPIGYEGGMTGTCPTQNLVDSYEMQTTGLGINDAGSGYVSTDPYTGRDPRMAATVLYNGSIWKGDTLECYEGGMNGPPKDRATKTGYYLKKYLIEAISLNPVSPTTRIHYWVIFRYGEILLNYAEAMNEAFGPYDVGPGTLNMTAAQAVNIVRTRAGMPAFPEGMTKDAFRTKLRNERRVELAFEDHRFWDIRRWKIGSSTSTIDGVNITKDASDLLTFTKKTVETRVWSEKMNLYPINQNEIYINENLEQNTLW